AALFAVYRRRAARAAATGFGGTTRARQHRAGIFDVIAHACFPLGIVATAFSPGALTNCIQLDTPGDEHVHSVIRLFRLAEWVERSEGQGADTPPAVASLPG